MVITDVIICDIEGERAAEVLIEGSKVVRIAESIEAETKISGNGAYLMPGLIDTNVRLKDGQLNGRNLEFISRQALKGGVSTVVLSPDSSPQIDNAIELEFVQSNNKSLNGAQIETTLSAVNEEGTLSDIAIMLKKGALSPYFTTSISNNLACRIAEYGKMYGKTLHVKAQDTSLQSSGVMVEGKVATSLGLGGIPPIGEVLHVARMIEISRKFGVQVLFKSIASPRSIAMISQAKSEGVKVFCEVALEHLTHADTACDNFNTAAKIDPPLPQEGDRVRLENALKANRIDMLTVLHQPNSKVNKEVAFFDAAYGSEAIEEALTLYYTKLVKSGLLNMQELLRLCVVNPGKSIGKECGVIKEGIEADLVLFDPSASLTVENPHSLYNGETLQGRVNAVIKSGELIRF